MPLFLGVDAGGSRTTFALADADRVLARTETGSIKRLRVSAEHASGNLFQAFFDLERTSGVLLGAVDATCVGTSGESVPLVADFIREEFTARVGGKLAITGDVTIALDAAFHGGRGVLALAGTGSNVAARTSDGRLITVGGWGPALGDPGSGFTIGRQGLRAAFRALDREEPAPLIDYVLRFWGLKTVAQLVARANETPAPDLAALAPLVVSCAAEGDEACATVLRKGGLRLAETVLLAIERLSKLEQASVPQVACAGSILESVPAVRDAMTAELQRVHPGIVVLPGVVDAVTGALWRARSL